MFITALFTIIKKSKNNKKNPSTGKWTLTSWYIHIMDCLAVKMNKLVYTSPKLCFHLYEIQEQAKLFKMSDRTVVICERLGTGLNEP